MLKDLLLFAVLPACCGALAVGVTLALPGDAESASPRALFSVCLINGIAAFTLPGVIQVWFTMGETKRANQERELAVAERERADQAEERADQEREIAVEERKRADQERERARRLEERARQAEMELAETRARQAEERALQAETELAAARSQVAELSAALAERRRPDEPPPANSTVSD